jgi:uncharacterized protein YuzE
MKLKYDKTADAIYITLSTMPYAYGKDLDDLRRVDYAADGNPIGIELLCVGHGVCTDDLPYKREVERMIEDEGIKIFA